MAGTLPADSKGETMAKIKFFLALLIVGLFLVVVVQNAEVVALRAFVWEVQLSRIILLVLPLVLGFVLGYLAAKIGSATKTMRK